LEYLLFNEEWNGERERLMEADRYFSICFIIGNGWQEVKYLNLPLAGTTGGILHSTNGQSKNYEQVISDKDNMIIE